MYRANMYRECLEVIRAVPAKQRHDGLQHLEAQVVCRRTHSHICICGGKREEG
jgi:hypothetical protein